MKVVLVGTIGDIGGPPIHTRNLVNEMAKFQEVQLHVITKGEEDKIMKRGNMTVHVLRSFEFYILGEIIHACRVWNKISEIDPDIVHYQGISPYLLFHHKYPAVLTIHGMFSVEVPLRVRGWKYFVFGFPRILLERMVLSKVKNIIAVSPYVKEIIAPRVTARIRVIPNGVDKDFFCTCHEKSDSNRLLFVGFIEPRKGLLDLIKALKIIKNSVPSVKLIVIGKKTDLKYFRQFLRFVKSENLMSNIIYLGTIDKNELKKEYQKCSIFVLPSREETFGIVLLEAMASCRPVIATNVGGIPYVVKDGENGFLVDEGNISGLAEKILYLLKNDNLRNEMGYRNMRIAKKFDWKTIAQETINFYYETSCSDIKSSQM